MTGRSADDSFTGILREAALGLVSVRMSKVAFHLDYVVFPPIAILSLWFSGETWAYGVGLFMIGFVSWTFAEYFLHRYVLHHWPYFSGLHLAHHDEPRALIASPTLFSATFFAIAALAPAWLLLGKAAALAWFSGFVTGYLAFGAVHEAVHHSDSQSAPMRYWKRLHALHHHGDIATNFGVLTNFWDHVFGTAAKPRQRPRARR